MLRRRISGVIALCLVLISLAASLAPAAAAQDAPTVIYLPLISSDVVLPPPPEPEFILSVEITRGAPSRIPTYISEVEQAGVPIVRYNGLIWHEIEKTKGVRTWSVFDREFLALAKTGMSPMIVIRGTPEWAQQPQNQTLPGSSCSPIKREEFGAFADFLREAVERYSKAPYNIRYWEIGNEPDVSPTVIFPDAPFGCWGNENDAYYGGGYFAEMLQAVVPAMKQADPSAKIILGGLLLDCDPAAPPDGRTCKASNFLEGILQPTAAVPTGGGHYLDMFAYHGYVYWSGDGLDWDRTNTTWRHRGGVVVGKLNFMQSVIAKYAAADPSLSSKPIIANEIGLICWQCNPEEQWFQNRFLVDQAIYVIRGYTRAWGNGLAGATWYTLDDPNWPIGEIGLIDGRTPRPGYDALLFLSELLRGAHYIGPLGDTLPLEGYAFGRAGVQYLFYWTNDSSSQTVPIPATATGVYVFNPTYRTSGGDIWQMGPPPAGGTLTVGAHPIVVVNQP